MLLVLFTRHLKESPRRHESRGDHASADAVLRDIEARVAAEHGPVPEPAPPVEEKPVAMAPLRLLLQRKYLLPTLLAESRAGVKAILGPEARSAGVLCTLEVTVRWSAAGFRCTA